MATSGISKTGLSKLTSFRTSNKQEEVKRQITIFSELKDDASRQARLSDVFQRHSKKPESTSLSLTLYGIVTFCDEAGIGNVGEFSVLLDIAREAVSKYDTSEVVGGSGWNLSGNFYNVDEIRKYAVTCANEQMRLFTHPSTFQYNETKSDDGKYDNETKTPRQLNTSIRSQSPQRSAFTPATRLDNILNQLSTAKRPYSSRGRDLDSIPDLPCMLLRQAFEIILSEAELGHDMNELLGKLQQNKNNVYARIIIVTMMYHNIFTRDETFLVPKNNEIYYMKNYCYLKDTLKTYSRVHKLVQQDDYINLIYSVFPELLYKAFMSGLAIDTITINKKFELVNNINDPVELSKQIKALQGMISIFNENLNKLEQISGNIKNDIKDKKIRKELNDAIETKKSQFSDAYQTFDNMLSKLNKKHDSLIKYRNQVINQEVENLLLSVESVFSKLAFKYLSVKEFLILIQDLKNFELSYDKLCSNYPDFKSRPIFKHVDSKINDLRKYLPTPLYRWIEHLYNECYKLHSNENTDSNISNYMNTFRPYIGSQSSWSADSQQMEDICTFLIQVEEFLTQHRNSNLSIIPSAPYLDEFPSVPSYPIEPGSYVQPNLPENSSLPEVTVPEVTVAPAENQLPNNDDNVASNPPVNSSSVVTTRQDAIFSDMQRMYRLLDDLFDSIDYPSKKLIAEVKDLKTKFNKVQEALAQENLSCETSYQEAVESFEKVHPMLIEHLKSNCYSTLMDLVH